MRNNVLIIKKNNKNVFFKKLKYVEKFYVFSEDSFIIRKVKERRIRLVPRFLNRKLRKNLNQYDTIIFFDNGYNKRISEYVKKRDRNIRTIFWYWNALVEYNNKLIDDPNIDEIWTYNKLDADKYKLKYNTQFFNYDFINEKKLKNSKIKNDVIFLGRDKNRRSYIDEINIILQNNNIRCNFKIVEDTSEYVKYEKYINSIIESKCILDYGISDHTGLSLRILEALFLNKKLITNNKEVKKFEFYNKNNIFIIGEDDWNSINDFMSKPLIEIDSKIKKYYDINSWIERFFA